MSSAQKNVIFNTRERVVSTDQNRAQSFHEATLAEVLRYMMLVFTFDDFNANALTTEFTTALTPPRSRVLNGLLVRPQQASTSLLVDPGAMLMIDPEVPFNTDESTCKVIIDPGLQTLGQLTITANSSGQTRIDVIECSRVETVIEQDNRDQFNPATGLFSPVLFNKVQTGQLAYRVRTGTPGGGFPGLVSEWVPLAVASVQNGATTWDQAVLWDVRDLAVDGVRQPFYEGTSLFGEPMRPLLFTDVVTSPGQARLQGTLTGTLGQRRAGGVLATGANNWINLTDATNIQEPGFTPTTGSYYYLYFAFPFSMFRWVRYDDPVASGGAANRLPKGPRGIPIVSSKSPVDMTGAAPLSLALPSGLGLGGTTATAVALAAGLVGASNTLRGILSDGIVQRAQTIVAAAPTQHIVTSSNVTGQSASFPFVDATDVPIHARAMWVTFGFTLNLTGGGSVQNNPVSVDVWDDQLNLLCTVPLGSEIITMAAGSSGFTTTFTARIPLPPKYPNRSNSSLRTVIFNFGQLGTGITLTGGVATMAVHGWELGP